MWSNNTIDLLRISNISIVITLINWNSKKRWDFCIGMPFGRLVTTIAPRSHFANSRSHDILWHYTGFMFDVYVSRTRFNVTRFLWQVYNRPRQKRERRPSWPLVEGIPRDPWADPWRGCESLWDPRQHPLTGTFSHRAEGQTVHMTHCNECNVIQMVLGSLAQSPPSGICDTPQLRT
jgi:hypothetical protein